MVNAPEALKLMFAVSPFARSMAEPWSQPQINASDASVLLNM